MWSGPGREGSRLINTAYPAPVGKDASEVYRGTSCTPEGIRHSRPELLDDVGAGIRKMNFAVALEYSSSSLWILAQGVVRVESLQQQRCQRFLQMVSALGKCYPMASTRWTREKWSGNQTARASDRWFFRMIWRREKIIKNEKILWEQCEKYQVRYSQIKWTKEKKAEYKNSDVLYDWEQKNNFVKLKMTFKKESTYLFSNTSAMAKVNTAIQPAAKKMTPTHKVAWDRVQANWSIASGVKILRVKMKEIKDTRNKIRTKREAA